MPESLRFTDRVAFVTGAAAGFGLAFARAFAEEGASVVLADIDRAAADGAAAALRGDGHRAVAVHCDVAHEDEVEAAVTTAVAELGGIDILVNNAGLHLTKYNQPFGTLSRAELRALLDVNVVGVVNCSLACRDVMRARGGGSICNIASIAGHKPASPYGVSKLAVRGLTQALATELAPDRIRVNAVSPGLMATEAAMADLPAELVRTFVDDLQLVHRTGQVGDVVAAVLFLSSDAASFVTGETLKVSGGYPLGI
jgi:NAD(P)-dependent dehydrogenase (short-subunit alcohol dehydrogenase family)